jgi:Family of unknown function (DUF5331)
MSDILTQPEQFKAELKEKWLNYYQENRNWLQRYMNNSSGWCDKAYCEKETLKDLGFNEDYTPRRPECYFILGVVSILEPQVTNILAFVENFTNNSEYIVNALGLNFDPEIELKIRSQQSENINDIREVIKT